VWRASVPGVPDDARVKPGVRVLQQLEPAVEVAGDDERLGQVKPPVRVEQREVDGDQAFQGGLRAALEAVDQREQLPRPIWSVTAFIGRLAAHASRRR
jgi:hypothetical protein